MQERYTFTDQIVGKFRTTSDSPTWPTSSSRLDKAYKIHRRLRRTDETSVCQRRFGRASLPKNWKQGKRRATAHESTLRADCLCQKARAGRARAPPCSD